MTLDAHDDVGSTLVERYRTNYHLPPEIRVTGADILRHWSLEQGLRDELLAAPADRRGEVFDRCYTTLYRQLPWLNASSDLPESAYQEWFDLIGRRPLDIYEIGSGGGGLINGLARKGHRCTATEITLERGARSTTSIRRRTSDGVHLDRFEDANSFDVVLSNQVIEHLHPDDLVEHFRGAHAILRPGGRYIHATPHRYIGPSDVSLVFGEAEPKGMHLKEYTYSELVRALRSAGFATISSPVRFPRALRQLSRLFRPHPSRLYRLYLQLLESVLRDLPHRKRIARLAVVMYFSGTIFLIAEKARVPPSR